MGCIGLWRHGLHHDGHEAVESATELRALAVEHALSLDEGVDAVDAAGGGISLQAEGRNGEAVENILAGHQEADVGTSRQRQPLVDLEATDHARLQILISHHVTLELVESRDLCTLQVLLRRCVVLGLHIAELETLCGHLRLHLRMALAGGGQNMAFNGASMAAGMGQGGKVVARRQDRYVS
eukprot:CAMPEP_0115135372 /NCGR_PEP_ID=MMETSP0227-20121206/55683_1 /TAXON_ID=89957 /ORGANISM="Polarella glacialis, Strain CCMP 1383" /LENGTH=181 /DNA_ID=CAMNT_0002542091 /DNA_START=72 /DNA_END=618 /DNA_ORIENTATION=-